MRRFLTTALLGVALMAPAVMSAEQRYYDKDKRDYHEWNDNENRAYHHWLEENHHRAHEWTKANKREQRDYWRWRHDHMDWK